jgi:hypothetical protein
MPYYRGNRNPTLRKKIARIPLSSVVKNKDLIYFALYVEGKLKKGIFAKPSVLSGFGL